MKFIVSWWDEKQGIGVAVDAGGSECILHRSNISAVQASQLKPKMIINGETKRISNGINIIEKLRTSKNFENAKSFRKTNQAEVA